MNNFLPEIEKMHPNPNQILLSITRCCSVFRRYDVLSLHQDRPNDVRPCGRLNPSHEPVFRNAARETSILAHWRVRDAGYILQLRAEPAHGKVHGEGEVVRALRDEHLRDHWRRVHCSRSDRLAALSLSACDTEEDRVRKVQLNTLGLVAAAWTTTDPNSVLHSSIWLRWAISETYLL